MPAAAGATAVVLLLGLTAAAHLAGYRALVISSGSRQPVLAVGDLVVSRSTPAGRLHPGDIVTFHDPALGNRFVTHRVVEVVASRGQVSVRTRATPTGSRNTGRWPTPHPSGC
jgi:signal peptidase I